MIRHRVSPCARMTFYQNEGINIRILLTLTTIYRNSRMNGRVLQGVVVVFVVVGRRPPTSELGV